MHAVPVRRTNGDTSLDTSYSAVGGLPSVVGSYARDLDALRDRGCLDSGDTQLPASFGVTSHPVDQDAVALCETR